MKIAKFLNRLDLWYDNYEGERESIKDNLLKNKHMNLVPVKACIRLFNHFVSYLPRTTIAWEISQNIIVYAMR